MGDIAETIDATRERLDQIYADAISIINQNKEANPKYGVKRITAPEGYSAEIYSCGFPRGDYLNATIDMKFRARIRNLKGEYVYDSADWSTASSIKQRLNEAVALQFQIVDARKACQK